MILNSLVNMVPCVVSPFFSFTVVRESVVRRKGFMDCVFVGQ